MRILMLSESDPAGMGIAFTKAINQHTEHSCRLITLAEKYNFGFEKDIHVPDEIWDRKLTNDDREKYLPMISDVENLLKHSDIFHFHILSDESMEIGPFKVKDFIKGKKIVHHHHGHPDFRANPDKYRVKYQKLKRKVLVSTPDLLLGMPPAYWMPNLVPIHNPLYMPTEERYEEFTIGHSPTRLSLKNTAELITAANKAGVNVDIIMNTPHKECLRRKQKCHVIFDHLQGYYGVSSLEGLSMGKPVIAKLSDWVSINVKKFAETEELPWWGWDERMFCSVETINFVGFIKRTGELNRDFMVNHWSDKKVVSRLIKFYETL